MASIDVVRHYEVLGVNVAATHVEIKRAYRQQALKHHPDKSSSRYATLRFQQIQRAWEVLGSVRGRFLYDMGPSNEAARRRATEEQHETRSLVQSRLLEASKAGKSFEVMKLLRGSNTNEVNAFDDCGRTALMYAAERDFTQVVSLLLLYHADANLADAEGWTPLILAASAMQELREDNDGNPARCIATLLAAKAEANAQTTQGVTALMLVCAAGHLQAAQLLLDHGADANAADDNGTTALVLAADSGHLPIVEILLAANASPDVAPKDGCTPLWLAATAGHTDMTALLLKYGADPCCAGPTGEVLQDVLQDHTMLTLFPAMASTGGA